jgi:hypothetical protein
MRYRFLFNFSGLSDNLQCMGVFLIGSDLVEFDRRDLPIYATPETLWAEAGNDAASYGAPLDRLFGEPEEVFVTSLAGADTLQSLAPLVDDALVTLAGLADGLPLPPAAEHPNDIGALDDHVAATPPSPEIAMVYDFTSDPWSSGSDPVADLGA